MKQVIQTLKNTEAERRIPVLRLEIDYELATLHDALVEKNPEQIKRSKKKLERLRQEMLQLET
ncbi:hypothetical protein [Pseudalkalibacillus berkeleyi]|uniref:Uncharacterized protein n=1 Tax=Pseudalkalibacillus berkeleyi TaxID=1069813 RepID=A0ABS9GZE2_9BACL|nr:hypothetical protein [Pseudalkalibacillus berkeleyi]MCF6136953.1 hypothetical protein [Pseudalkalibacillus berkeleyi]